MGSSSLIIDWLRSNIGAVERDLVDAYQFGSSLRPGHKPSDIDVVLVSLDGAGEPAWLRTRAAKQDLKDRFHAAFRIPLSVMVVTPSEWAEIDGIIVRDRVSLVQGRSMRS